MDDSVEYYHALCSQLHVTRVEKVFSPERDEIAVSRTRQPPFSHLDVEAGLRAVRLPLDACLALGPWEQPTANGVFFIPGAILKVCLLGCPPFIGLDPPQSRDVREHVSDPRAREVDCQDRDALFDGLTEALFAYEMGCRDLQAAWREVLRRQAEGIAGLWDVLPSVAGLYRRHQSFADSTIGLSPREFIDKTRDLLLAGRKMQAVDVRRGLGGMPQAWAMTQQLVQDMAHAFEAYGPSTFPRAAMHAALEAILRPFGVCNQRGEPLTAAGIKSLRRRRRPPFSTRDGAIPSEKP